MDCFVLGLFGIFGCDFMWCGLSVLSRMRSPSSSISTKWWTLAFVFMCAIHKTHGLGYQTDMTYTRAVVNITYRDVKGDPVTDKDDSGVYSPHGLIDSEHGWVHHVRDPVTNKSFGCQPLPRFKERWIALIERGNCNFHEKIYNAAKRSNASAVVIYNEEGSDQDFVMKHNVEDVVTVSIRWTHGMELVRLVDNGTRVYMYITRGGPTNTPHLSNINKTSVLFVSISFIVLMIISLAWLVFYYIQRFRYAHAKERLSRRLMNAAKKAITKMPLRTIKSGDKEVDSEYDQCAVCIESYRPHDVLRILPCKHMFHKSCVDPWLIEQRSCPMCKLDILKAYGMQIHGSGESVVNIDAEVPSTSMGPSDLGMPLSSRDIDCESVEPVRYQPAQVEYHSVPAPPMPNAGTSSQGAEDWGDECPGCGADASATGSTRGSMAKLAAARSLESIKSCDSDSNELQSLMQAASDDNHLDETQATVS